MPSETASLSLPTGALGLDLVLGGGLPRQGVSEINGASGSGKTTLLLCLAAQAQLLGESVAWIDAGDNLEPALARRCGIDPARLFVANPPEACQAFDLVEELAHCPAFGLVILDALEALLPFDEAERNVGSRLSLALRRICEPGVATALVIATGGLPVHGPLYHDLAAHPQRLALKLHATVRLRLKVCDGFTLDHRPAGCHVHVQVLKDTRPAKNFPCRGRPGFDIMYEQGIISACEAFDLGLQLGLIVWLPAGGYAYQGVTLGARQTDCLASLRRDPGLCFALEQDVRRNMFDPAVEPASTGASAATA